MPSSRLNNFLNTVFSYLQDLSVSITSHLQYKWGLDIRGFIMSETVKHVKEEFLLLFTLS